MKESFGRKKKRVYKMIRILRKAYPHARCALHFLSPLELLVATILSAQCTDKRVNQVTPALFKKFRCAEDYAKADVRELENDIRSAGFYKNKARNIIGACRAIVDRFKGVVPDNMEALVTLRGVGRKTANVVLGNAFGIPGIPVDTHMIRLNRRLGLTRHTDPVKIEFDLMPLVPQKDWTEYSHLMIQHGRDRCFARKPDCTHCEIQKICPSADKLVK